MSVYKTWDEVADYLQEVQNIKYLDNPTEWANAFREYVKDGRMVETINDAGDSVIGFLNEHWLQEGQWLAPVSNPETGLKSIPTIPEIITDATTGGATAGALAEGIGTAGTTVTLTTAGVVASAIAGLGLGVAGYELAPEFFTDLSNAMFEPITGQHLTYPETEPFLRKKISVLLGLGEGGKLTTYVDKDMMERAYNFVKTHIQAGGYSFLDDITFTNFAYPNQPFVCQRTEDAIPFTSAKVDGGLTTERIQNCMHELWLQETSLVPGGGEPSLSSVINKIREQYPNYNNAGVFSIVCRGNYINPTVGWVHTVFVDGLVNRKVTNRDIIHGYVGSSRFLSKQASQPYEDSDFGYMFELQSIEVDYPSPLFSSRYDVEDDVMSVRDDGYSYYGSQQFVGINVASRLPALPPDQWVLLETYTSNLAVNPTNILDDYLNRNGVTQQGNTPVNNKTAEEQYPYWFNNKKNTSQPDREGGERSSSAIPSDVPAGEPDDIINNGVNNGTGSYEKPQSTSQNGHSLPIENPVSVINDSIDDNIDRYNNSKVSPETAPEPAPEGEPLPQYPTQPPTEPEGDSGDTPTPTQIGGVTASGMVSVYNPTKQELTSFSGWLWSPSFLDNFLKLFANPMDAIIGLHIMYATPISGGRENIVCGYLDSGVSSKVVTQQYSKVDCGTITIPEFYGNATDYEPYTSVHIYLPFIGIVPLKPNDVLGKQIHVEYGVDALTGTCLATIKTIKGDSEIICYTFAGNCAVQIPVSGGNYAQMITGLAGFIVAGAGAVATGNPVMALGAGASFMSGNTQVQHSGAIGSNAGACGVRKPYVIVTRKKAYNAQNYQHYYGFPSNMHVTLSSCKGYTQVKSCHVESIYRATDNEKKEIDSLLKDGVIIV